MIIGSPGVDKIIKTVDFWKLNEQKFWLREAFFATIAINFMWTNLITVPLVQHGLIDRRDKIEMLQIYD